MDEAMDLLKLYDATINHPFNNIKEETLKKLWALDKAAGERLEAERKKEAEDKKKEAEDASKKGKPNA